MKFQKADHGKSRLDLVPPKSHDAVGKVLAFGAKKYQPNNWRLVDNQSRYVGAAERHINSFKAGEDIDPDSGLPHLAHALCSLYFLLECQLSGYGRDDRLCKMPMPIGDDDLKHLGAALTVRVSSPICTMGEHTWEWSSDDVDSPIQKCSLCGATR